MPCVVCNALVDVGDMDLFVIFMGMWVIFVVSGGDFGFFKEDVIFLFWCWGGVRVVDSVCES